jgi:Fur family peroxide stress response transcriptional regulator
MLDELRSRGLRLTPQRVAVVRELAQDESHPTAQELFDRLRASLPTMSFATVYNTLDALRRADLCSALALSPGSGRFDPNVSPHDHLVCDRCGSVRDLMAADTRALPRPTRASARSRLATVAPRFELRAVEQVFRGLCPSCSTATAAGAAAPPGSRRPITTAAAPPSGSPRRRPRSAPARSALDGPPRRPRATPA